MRFSIITPCFNGMPYLPCCVRSVADQARDPRMAAPGTGRSDPGGSGLDRRVAELLPEVSVTHIVADGGSTDGSVEWLKTHAAELDGENYRLAFFSEPDRGMYDAINKGVALAMRHAGGDHEAADRARAWGVVSPAGGPPTPGDSCGAGLFAWLNCDEQYLPGTLRKVARFFTAHPRVDVMHADMLQVRPDGSLISFRKSCPLRRAYVMATHLYAASCTLFWRERISRAGIRFDSAWQACGDQDYVLGILGAGYRAGYLREFLSAFTMTGQNLGGSERAGREIRTAFASYPPWVRVLAPALRLMRVGEKALYGAYRQRFPLEYGLYLPGQEARTTLTARAATFKWRQG